MRREMMGAAGACGLALALGSASLAAPRQDAPGGGDRPGLGEIRKVSGLLAADALNRADRKVASVDDLILAADGTVMYAVLGHGGVAGVGATSTAVPWRALDVRHVDGTWAVTLDLTEEALGEAPTLRHDDFREFADPRWVARVHDFFRPSPEGEGTDGREPGARQDPATAAARLPRALPVVIRASKIIGAAIENPRHEDLGAVEDLLLDRADRVAFAIFGLGGVLDAGERFIPVPWSELRLIYNRSDTSITVSIEETKQHLEKAPLVRRDSYATLLAPGFTEQVRRHFEADGTEPDPGRGPRDEPGRGAP